LRLRSAGLPPSFFHHRPAVLSRRRQQFEYRRLVSSEHGIDVPAQQAATRLPAAGSLRAIRQTGFRPVNKLAAGRIRFAEESRDLVKGVVEAFAKDEGG